MKTSKTIRNIPISSILKGANYREPKNIEQLAISIKSEGQIVPIHVTKKKDNYIVLDGFRRLAAVEFANRDLGANFETMKAVIVEENLGESDRALMQMLLNESLQSPLEKAIKISELVEKGMKPKRIAEAFGVKEAYISMIKKKIVPDDIFRLYLNNGTIIFINDKENNKRKYFSNLEQLNKFVGNDVEKLKKASRIVPGEEKLNLNCIDPIADVYYKLKELEQIDLFQEMIAKLQHKKIYDKPSIERVCKSYLKSINAENMKKPEKKFDKNIVSQKVTNLFVKFKPDSDTLAEINRKFTENGLNFEIIIKK